MQFDPSTLVYNDAGLIPAIAQDHETKEVLMMAWMNQEAVETLKQRYHWSRSRQAFWIKGGTSGHTQELVEFRYDCDADAILVLVNQTGAACHTNRRHCFDARCRMGPWSN